MDNVKLCEKINKYKQAGLSDSDVLLKLYNEDTNKVLNKLYEYHEKQKTGQRLLKWLETVDIIDDHNEYGIPMINTDADW